MAFNRTSIATIDSPEFINITKMNNPLISKCEVKVLYIGKNRNGSFISKEVATEMAKTLPGAPIVGYYSETKEDFTDHGDQMIIDSEGVKFKNLTRPYGFVAPDSKIWFQKFDDTDEFGNVTTREYLMTEGYLWTGQYKEAKRVIERGNPQSMELDNESLEGYWSEDSSTGLSFFIINDAVISKLCILGEDVEPCFEGANISEPKLSSNFSKNDELFKHLFTMMKELKYTLNNVQGEKSMDKDNTVKDFPVDDKNDFSNKNMDNFEKDTTDKNDTTVVENFTDNSNNNTDNVNDDFAACGDKKKTAKCEKDEEPDSKDKKDEKDPEPKEDDKKDVEENACGKKKKYELTEEDLESLKSEYKLVKEEELNSLKSEYEKLKSDYALLENNNKELLTFKQEIENKQKDELINSFYMLSDEDKKDVIENKSNYSFEDIKAKLSIICFDKKVDFNLDKAQKKEIEKTTPVTYNLNNHEQDELPAWLRVVENIKNNKDNI